MNITIHYSNGHFRKLRQVDEIKHYKMANSVTFLRDNLDDEKVKKIELGYCDLNTDYFTVS